MVFHSELDYKVLGSDLAFSHFDFNPATKDLQISRDWNIRYDDFTRGESEVEKKKRC